MRHIISTAVILFLSAGSIFSQSMLRVSLSDRTPITVSVDGRYFNKRGESVTVGDLPQGRHYLKVFTIEQNRRGRGKEVLIHEGNVKTYRGQLTVFTIDAFNGQTSITEEEMGYAQNAQPGNYGNGRNDNPDRQNNGNRDGYSYNQNTPPPPPDVNNNPPAVAAPAPPPAPDESADKPAVKESKLDKLKKKIADKNTDTEKLEAIKESLKKEYLSTAQVCTVMEWFSFESAKVEFAKWAYPKTNDKANFGQVKNKLTYKSYIDDIDNFVREYR